MRKCLSEKAFRFAPEGFYCSFVITLTRLLVSKDIQSDRAHGDSSTNGKSKIVG